ncbi:unnamed protein product [Cochlearia groenlandica]
MATTQDKAAKDLAEVKAKQDLFETSFREITSTKAESKVSGKKISEDQRDMFEDAKEGQKKLGGLDDDNPKEQEIFKDDLVPYSGRGQAEAARNRGRGSMAKPFTPWPPKGRNAGRGSYGEDGGGEWNTTPIGVGELSDNKNSLHDNEYQEKWGKEWLEKLGKMKFMAFDGTTDPVEWIQKCDDYFDDQRTNESAKLRQATFVLTGIAKR